MKLLGLNKSEVNTLAALAAIGAILVIWGDKCQKDRNRNAN
jgi:hypothetical protein